MVFGRPVIWFCYLPADLPSCQPACLFFFFCILLGFLFSTHCSSASDSFSPLDCDGASTDNSLLPSAIRLSVHSSNHSFLRSCVHAFTHSSIHSIPHVLTHSCTHSLTHPFIYSSKCPSGVSRREYVPAQVHILTAGMPTVTHIDTLQVMQKRRTDRCRRHSGCPVSSSSQTPGPQIHGPSISTLGRAMVSNVTAISFCMVTSEWVCMFPTHL